MHELSLEEKLAGLEDQLQLRNWLFFNLDKKQKSNILALIQFAKLQFENMFNHYQLQIDFINKMIEELKTQENAQTKLTKEDLQKYFD
ncbi:hypothetical protein [Lysinibacillus endophyticus]|uniref:hypothetical protein n=1 Tax=Ureibacillus endophyticus TaxID=1978490 RepID=UPI003136C94A